MYLEKILRLRHIVAFRLTVWYSAFFIGTILIAFITFHFLLLRGIHHVYLSPYSLHELLEAYRRFFGYALAGVALVSIFFGWLLGRRALSGVEDVRQTAQSIAKGEFARRVPVKGTGDEVDQLAVTFNGMIERIESVICSMKDIIDNIAHDLRSPITRMRGVAELALTRKRSVEDYETVVGRVIEECDRLLGMINTMLEISEAEAGIARLRPIEVNAGEMARDVIDLFAPVAEDKHISVILREAGALLLQADAQKLQRVLSNLLDNALKFTPSGGSVMISVYGTDKAVRIIVRDTGTGIPAPELSHIFDRFYRGEKSRSEPGSGLGLSLAQAFVLAHRGTITVTSTPDEGSEFTITLPKGQA
jgi:heavy metal sensor kinase